LENIIIIGNGISGITAARHIRKKSNANITVISSETKYFFSRTALMYIYMGHMKFEHTQPFEPWFWKKNRINLIQDYVETIDFKNKSLSLKNAQPVKYDKLILAVGSKPNKFGWPGQDLKGVQGLYSYQDLLELEENTKNGIKRAVIVGGGLIGIELAEMLLSRNYPVTFLVREESFWGNILPKEDSELIMRHMAEHHVDLKLKLS
jgi:NAD(P)H-nitrite reductase large subunit